MSKSESIELRGQNPSKLTCCLYEVVQIFGSRYSAIKKRISLGSLTITVETFCTDVGSQRNARGMPVTGADENGVVQVVELISFLVREISSKTTTVSVGGQLGKRCCLWLCKSEP